MLTAFSGSAPDGVPPGVRPRRVLIVDDSRTIRALLRSALDEDPRIEVVGEASDPYEAREMIKTLSPDVLTLDVEMPRMNGLDFLERLMRLRPMPVVMVSTRTRERSADAVRALFLGAVDCVDVGRLQVEPARRARLADTLYHASMARVRARAAPRAGAGTADPGAFRWNGRIVLLGSSTGGVDALERVLSGFPPSGPPVLVAQHMPHSFLRSFAHRLNEMIAPEVRLAEDGMPIRQGEVVIAPGGDRHMSISSGRMGDRIVLSPATAEDLYVPSVDALFASAVPVAPRILAVILTGMGRDGATPLPGLRAAGARVFAQSAETSVVDGMPRAARETGAVERDIGIDDLGAAILEAASAGRRGLGTGAE